MDFYLSTLQGRNKWREIARNLHVGELVLVGDAEDVAVRGKYRMGRIAEAFLEIHQGKPLVRRANIAVTEYDSRNDIYKVEHIYRSISRIAPVGRLEQLNSEWKTGINPWHNSKLDCDCTLYVCDNF